MAFGVAMMRDAVFQRRCENGACTPEIQSQRSYLWMPVSGTV